MIVISLCAIAATGTALAGETDSLRGSGDHREITRPGNGPRHDFMERVSELIERAGRMMGMGPGPRLGGSQAGSCHVCPDPPPPVEQPAPAPRRNDNRPDNRGSGNGNGWLF